MDDIKEVKELEPLSIDDFLELQSEFQDSLEEEEKKVA